MRCLECGAETAGATPACVMCGGPASRQRSVAADPAAGAVPVNDAARSATGDEIRDATFLVVGGGHDVAQGQGWQRYDRK
jgi:hypothetical protein